MKKAEVGLAFGLSLEINGDWKIVKLKIESITHEGMEVRKDSDRDLEPSSVLLAPNDCDVTVTDDLGGVSGNFLASPTTADCSSATSCPAAVSSIKTVAPSVSPTPHNSGVSSAAADVHAADFLCGLSAELALDFASTTAEDATYSVAASCPVVSSTATVIAACALGFINDPVAPSVLPAPNNSDVSSTAADVHAADLGGLSANLASDFASTTADDAAYSVAASCPAVSSTAAEVTACVASSVSPAPNDGEVTSADVHADDLCALCNCRRCPTCIAALDKRIEEKACDIAELIRDGALILHEGLPQRELSYWTKWWQIPLIIMANDRLPLDTLFIKISKYCPSSLLHI